MPQFTCPSVRFDLGEQAEMIRDAVAGFAQREIAPLAAEIDRSNQFPRQLWPKLGELGLLGLTVEEEYGGSGLGYLEHVVAVEQRLQDLLEAAFGDAGGKGDQHVLGEAAEASAFVHPRHDRRGSHLPETPGRHRGGRMVRSSS